MEYLKHWQFWLAVVVVALVTHFLLTKFSGLGSIGATS